MFEAEVEMEKRSSSWLPMVLILILALAVLSGVGYLIYQSKAGKLTPEQATAVLTPSLKARPATLRFHSGNVVPSMTDKPTDPHYRVLEKAGIVKLANGKGLAKIVTLTANGESMVSAFPEFKPSKEADGTTLYEIPLAERKLVSVTNVTMTGLNAAKVEFTWKWEPTKLGESFDASSDGFKALPAWDRATLIQKYGADYYHGDPITVTANFIRGDKGWQIAP